MSERSAAVRRRLSVPISVSIEPEKTTSGKLLRHPTENLFVRGETIDLSETGIAFAVSAIRIKEYYLVGEERPLIADLDLPGGRIQMRIIGRRYEQTTAHSSVGQFLIGASISQMTETDREIYKDFLLHGGKAEGKLLQLKTGAR